MQKLFCTLNIKYIYFTLDIKSNDNSELRDLRNQNKQDQHVRTKELAWLKRNWDSNHLQLSACQLYRNIPRSLVTCRSRAPCPTLQNSHQIAFLVLFKNFRWILKRTATHTRNQDNSLMHSGTASAPDFLGSEISLNEL